MPHTIHLFLLRFFISLALLLFHLFVCLVPVHFFFAFNLFYFLTYTIIKFCFPRCTTTWWINLNWNNRNEKIHYDSNQDTHAYVRFSLLCICIMYSHQEINVISNLGAFLCVANVKKAKLIVKKKWHPTNKPTCTRDQLDHNR